MRILFISNYYPPYELGGYEQLCQEVVRNLADRAHNMSVLTSRYGTRRGISQDGENITRALYLQGHVDYYHPTDFFLNLPRREQSNLRELRQKLDRFEPDAIMIWGMWNLSQNLAYWAERWLPGRVAYYISSYWPIDKDPHTAYWTLSTRRPVMEMVKRPLRTLALAQLKKQGYPPRLEFQHAACCSKYVRDVLVAAAKLPARSQVIPCGIDPEPFVKHCNVHEVYYPARPLRLLYFGRLIHDKGVHTAIEAVSLLKKKGLANKIELTILGSGHPDYEAKLLAMVNELDTREQIRFIPQVSRQEIPEWLARFDVYLFTSLWAEPLARSVMEAMASGLLVIGTEVGGQVEMLTDNQNALTFPAGDALALAQRIVRVVEDPALMIKLANAGRQLVLEAFTLSRMVDKVENLLLGL